MFKTNILYKQNSNGSINQWQALVIQDGSVFLEVQYGQKDGKIQSTRTEIFGKNIGKRNETTPEEQAIKEAQSKYKKQIDKGYSEKIELRPISPMLAHKFDESKVTYPCFVQPKLDGIRALAFTNDGKVTIKSRNGKVFTELRHIEDELYSIREGIVFDGEIYCHEATFQEITSWSKKYCEETHKIAFHIYDIVSLDVFAERASKIASIIQGYQHLQCVETLLVSSYDDVLSYHQRKVKEGYEGIMLRLGDCSYQVGFRSHELVKFKSFDDDEFEIIGAEEGKGKSSGQATFICKTKDGGIFTVRPKGSDEQRREYLININDYIGKQLTVKYQGFTDDGLPRFPVGISIRNYE